MAGAVLVFQEHMVRSEQITAERDQERERAEAAKRQALLDMAETIEVEATQALTGIGERTGAMTQAADEMSNSADRTGASAKSAANVWSNVGSRCSRMSSLWMCESHP